MRHIEAFELDRVHTVSSRISEVASLSAALTQMTQGLSGFGRYLPVELVRALVARGRAINRRAAMQPSCIWTSRFTRTANNRRRRRWSIC